MVYLIADENGRAKIGYTKVSAQSRLRSLQTGNPHKLRLVWETHGSKHHEMLLHHYLQKYRLNGEWFDTDKCKYILYPYWGPTFVNSLANEWVSMKTYVIDLYIFYKYNLIYEVDPLIKLEKLLRQKKIVRHNSCPYLRGSKGCYYAEKIIRREGKKDIIPRFEDKDYHIMYLSYLGAEEE